MGTLGLPLLASRIWKLIPNVIRNANSLGIVTEKIKFWKQINVLAGFIKRTLAIWGLI